MNITQRKIRRDKLRSEIGLLVGNGEMGGLIRNDGLGFDELWLTDCWSHEGERAPIGPLRFSAPPSFGTATTLEQTVSLSDAIATTNVRYDSGAGYQIESFISQTHRHLMAFQLVNTSAEAQVWEFLMPAELVERDSFAVSFICQAQAAPMVLPFTKVAGVIRSSRRLEIAEPKRARLSLAPGETVELTISLVTSFDTLEFETQAVELSEGGGGYATLRENHLKAWRALWERFDVTLPEGLYADTFYRSLYYTFSITGASRFLPGVCQFADPGWGMIPFSNDAGYIAPLLASINHHERAAAMLQEFYKPESLRKNARVYLNILEAITTQEDFNDAYSFAQMINISGTESNFVYGRQRHLDGFIPAIFHRVSSLNPDDSECAEMTYDVLKGCSSFWQRMLFLDKDQDALLILKTLDLDEKTHGVSVMSAVIACRWTLMMFVRYARERGSDLEFAAECEANLQRIYWPENDLRFLSFPDDQEKDITSKYNCIRAFSTLSYPFSELVEKYDREKAYRTMDFTRERNGLEKIDSGVNAMTTNMYALSEAGFGRAEEAFDYASLALQRLDPSGVAMGEARTDALFYCSTSYSTFALATIQMLLQSYNGMIYPFPAVPKEWVNVSFVKLPAEAGIQVTASMIDGRPGKIIYEKDGCVLLETHDARPVRIVQKNGKINLSPAPAASSTSK